MHYVARFSWKRINLIHLSMHISRTTVAFWSELVDFYDPFSLTSQNILSSLWLGGTCY